MPTGYESTDYLAYIDAPPSDTSRDLILSQIHASRPDPATAPLHPRVARLAQSYEPTFTPAMLAEHTRIASGAEKTAPGTGIDMSRYSSIDAPETPTTPTSDEDRPELVAAWHSTLQRAYGASSFVSGRLAQLSLLETYGKNAWLMGNEAAEQRLRALEREYVDAKRRLEEVEQARSSRQDAVRAEMVLLEDGWKKAVRGLVDVQIATEELRGEILRRRREGAGG